jgi:hypothetical protein
MGGTRGMQGKKIKILTPFCFENLKEKDIPEEQETNGRIILKYILKK